MKAITTKYIGPATVRGARIKASDMDGNQVTIPYPHEMNWTDGATHRKAAEALCEKMDWNGRLVGGAIKGGWVWVFVD